MIRSASNPSKFLGNEEKYLKKVLASESWSSTGGSWSNKLESEFANLHSKKYAVAMNSGTATLQSALLALGVKPGDEVITPGLTVIMDTTAILHCHAVPVYVDIQSDTFNLDPKLLEKSITNKTKAIIVVSLYGLPANMEGILEVSRKFKIPIIEDNAQSMLSKYNGKVVGSFGEISSWSFENTKHISAGEGGIVTTDDEQLAIKLRKIGGHGFKNLRAAEGRIRLNQDIFQDPNYKRHDVLGWNFRLPEFNAAIALAQLERVDELVRLRQQSAEIFLNVLLDSGIFTPQFVPQNCEHSYYSLAAVYHGHEKFGVSWHELRKKYISEGGDGIYGAWSVPYLEPLMETGEFRKSNPDVYRETYYLQGICPVAESIQPKLMQFKTNYRDIKLAKRKAKILDQILRSIRNA